MLTLGALFAFLAALSFGITDATARRGVISGSPFEALLISIPVGVILFFFASLVTGQLFRVAELPLMSILLLCASGVVHFIWGRYWNFRTLQLLGSNLAAPVQQLGFIITLGLAILVLQESLSFSKVVGIILVLLGPLLVIKEAFNTQTQNLNFTPKFAQGYLAGFFSALGFGSSPILIRMALKDAPLGVSGGLIAYLAALVFLVLILTLQRRLISSFKNLNREAALWFSFAGVSVGFSQLFRYIALGLAPVVIVSSLVRLSLIFRILFSTLFNRKYELLSWLLIFGIAVSFIGGLVLVLAS